VSNFGRQSILQQLLQNRSMLPQNAGGGDEGWEYKNRQGAYWAGKTLLREADPVAELTQLPAG
jgi:hypothetical protein